VTGSQQTILVVDDDPGLRSQLKWALSEYYDVVTAGDRIQALAEFNKYKPGVVTLDLGLPPNEEGTDEGYAVLGAILGQSPDTKVVVISGSDAASNASRVIGAGAFEFHPKPIDSNVLLEIIHRAFLSFKE